MTLAGINRFKFGRTLLSIVLNINTPVLQSICRTIYESWSHISVVCDRLISMVGALIMMLSTIKNKKVRCFILCAKITSTFRVLTKQLCSHNNELPCLNKMVNRRKNKANRNRQRRQKGSLLKCWSGGWPQRAKTTRMVGKKLTKHSRHVKF